MHTKLEIYNSLL